MQKLRMSMLKDFETCPYLCSVNWGRLGELGKVDIEGSSTNKYADVGIALHEVFEIHGLNKMEGKDIPLKTLHKILDEKVDNFDIELFKDKDEIEMYRDSLHEQLDWGYETECLRHDTPIGVEVTFALDGLVDGIDIPFSGTMDRLSGKLNNKEVSLVDWKSGKVYTKKELENNIQATVYSLAFYRMFGFLPKEFRFIFTKHKKVKTVYITPDFLEKGIERILENWYRIKGGDTSPNTKNKYFCKNFCSINKECPCMNKSKHKGWELVS